MYRRGHHHISRDFSLIRMSQESSTALPLTNTSIVEIDGYSTEVPISFNYQLSPQTVIGEMVIHERNKLPPSVFKLLFTDRKEKFEVVLASGARFDAISIRGETKMGEDSYSRKISIIPARQPVTVVNKENPLTELIFPILNFPPIFGNQSKKINLGAHWSKIPYIQIGGFDWCIEMSGIDRTQDVWKSLNRERGIGVTYRGRITRVDKTEFTVEESKQLLNALRHFLSFTCGFSCGFPFVEGIDRSGKISWVQWGSHYVTPRNTSHSLLVHNGCDDILASLFPRFWHLLNHGDDWKETLFLAIDCYLLSKNSAIEVGIILVQVVLERLSSQILEKKRPRENTGEFIRRAFEKMRLKACLLEECDVFQAFQEANDTEFDDGLHAIVCTRNNFVHPIPKHNHLSAHRCHRVLNLGQWYIEMFLLKILDYQREYNDRRATWQSKSTRFPCVPWAESR